MQPNRPNRSYTNVMLTVIAGLLGVIAFDRASVDLTSRANAQPVEDVQPEDPTGRVSAAEQRKVMITELRNISVRLDRVEAALSRGISVKVVDMPPVRMQESSSKGDKP